MLLILNHLLNSYLIKNLKYEIKLNQDNQYIITSDLSEITYENNIEIGYLVLVIFNLKNKFIRPLMSLLNSFFINKYFFWLNFL